MSSQFRKCFLQLALVYISMIFCAQGQKKDWFVEWGIDLRTDRNSTSQSWGRPPGGYRNMNDGYLRYWMGGPFLQIGTGLRLYGTTRTGVAIRPSFH